MINHSNVSHFDSDPIVECDAMATDMAFINMSSYEKSQN